jgi:hypothetical protein
MLNTIKTILVLYGLNDFAGIRSVEDHTKDEEN